MAKTDKSFFQRHPGFDLYSLFWLLVFLVLFFLGRLFLPLLIPAGVVLAVGPLVLRVLYELILLLVMHVKTVREIQRKLDDVLWDAPSAAPWSGREEPEEPAPAVNQPMGLCPACGTW